ncbi:hypothetical protein GCM10025771_09910 [Niveibacterium umoris]|uniref:Cyanophycinase-like exopeptidase n=1 Tax=Niveibacterium umoris TaxID=1193620 RepID=A0A840BKG2_9RHOO|nr:cyanophycinase [Niveibacterium umoris]MBB4013460.1 cyanophycinase-like exopeptidase [Niveibacterium umoris]
MQGSTALRWVTHIVAALACTLALAAPKNQVPYTYSAVGNTAASVSVPAPSQPSYVLMGGGPDVDEAYRWMIQRAGITPGSGGRVVVIRATGTDAYNPYIFYSDAALSTSATIADGWVGGASLGVSSVETLVIPSVAAANDAFVNQVVSRAQVLWIAGGDQSDYLKYWKGTALETTLQTLMAKNIPIGGTSAGLMVMGWADFAALAGAVTSKQALDNPYNKYMSFDPNPLGGAGFISPDTLRNTILDAHLDARDRLGRLLSFVARLIKPNTAGGGCAGGVLASGTGSGGARGIGVDVETALLVQRNATAPVISARRVTNVSTTTESAVYFVRPRADPSVCAARVPLSMPNIEIQKLGDSSTVFDLSAWFSTDWSQLTPHYVDVTNGSLPALPWAYPL